jgi:hypothetical protein
MLTPAVTVALLLLPRQARMHPYNLTMDMSFGDGVMKNRYFVFIVRGRKLFVACIFLERKNLQSRPGIGVTGKGQDIETGRVKTNTLPVSLFA